VEEQEKGTQMSVAGAASPVLAVVTFLAMWGGITLLLTTPHSPRLPFPNAGPRGALTSLLLFWVPIVTGTIACLTGLVGLSAGARSVDIQRRTLISIFLGLAPIYLAAAWLSWLLLSTW